MNLAESIRLVNPAVRSLKAYHLTPEDTAVKLNQNESPYDWPAPIKQQVADFVLERPWNRYPEFIPQKLRESLARHVGVEASNVIVGNGSNEMLLVLLLSLVNPGKRVIVVQPTFTVYRLLVTGMGAVEESVLLNNDLTFNMDAILAAVRANPGALLIICSPNNPTGCALTQDQTQQILAAHTGFFILDQAYVEFGGYNAVELIAGHPNLIVTRTFSKAFAGAGLRLGYMIGAAQVIAEIMKIKLPYNINFFTDYVGQTLAANYSVAKERVAQICRDRDELYAFLRTLPFDNCYPTAANFMIVRTGRKQRLFEHLRENGILVRDVSGYQMLENCLRINTGSPDENARLKLALSSFFAG